MQDIKRFLWITSLALLVSVGAALQPLPSRAAYIGPPLSVAKGGNAGGGYVDLVSVQNVGGIKNLTAADVASVSLQVGASGTPITQIVIYTPTFTPSAVAANTTATQTFTVTGLTTADTVEVTTTSLGTGLGIVGYYVSAPDTLTIVYCNSTAGSLTPSSTAYRIAAYRS